MTDGPRLEVAEVFHRYGDPYRKAYARSPAQNRVLSALVQCRTAALGGHVEECDRCGEQQISYNSCRNRHCPKCQGSQTAQWLQAQQAHVLPISYSHVVFTLPQLLAPLALQNPRVVYGLLFRAASQTLLQVAADPRHLGARIGFLAILHTWGQTLLHHPHLHCVVPAGGLSLDGSRWISCSPNFFLPVRVLSRLFRGKFLALLQKAFEEERLSFHRSLEPLADPLVFARLLDRVRKSEWVVYAKAPFGGPEQVLKYLARYTHRVAISNGRLLSLQGGSVTFRYKNYAHGHRPQTMCLDALEFIRRFLLHVLPKGFVRIRHYGFLANCQREEKLARCRELLGGEDTAPTVATEAPVALDPGESTEDNPPPHPRCPICKEGHLRRVETLAPLASSRPPPLTAFDSS